jgi:hypothetical protein
MMAYVASEGRLFGLTPTDWAVLLVGMMLCGVLTPLYLVVRPPDPGWRGPASLPSQKAWQFAKSPTIRRASSVMSRLAAERDPARPRSRNNRAPG